MQPQSVERTGSDVLLFPIKIAMKLFSLLMTAAVAYLVLSGIQVVLAAKGSTDPTQYRAASDIVVVAPYGAGGAIDSEVSARLESAGGLFVAHLAPTVLVALAGDPAEFDTARSAAAAVLSSSGVNVAATHFSPVSAVSDALPMVAASVGAGTSVIIVTDAINALWTKGDAVGLGFAPQIVPTSLSKVAVYSEIDALLRETTGVAAGRIIGDQRASWAAN